MLSHLFSVYICLICPLKVLVLELSVFILQENVFDNENVGWFGKIMKEYNMPLITLIPMLCLQSSYEQQFQRNSEFQILGILLEVLCEL